MRSQNKGKIVQKELVDPNINITYSINDDGSPRTHRASTQGSPHAAFNSQSTHRPLHPTPPSTSPKKNSDDKLQVSEVTVDLIQDNLESLIEKQNSLPKFQPDSKSLSACDDKVNTKDSSKDHIEKLDDLEIKKSPSDGDKPTRHEEISLL